MLIFHPPLQLTPSDGPEHCSNPKSDVELKAQNVFLTCNQSLGNHAADNVARPLRVVPTIIELIKYFLVPHDQHMAYVQVKSTTI